MATQRYNLTVVANRPAWGTVSPASEIYSEGEVAVLAATAGANRSFLCWSDGSADNPHRFTMPAKDTVIKAYFYVTNPEVCLIDIKALAHFWNKVRQWFSEKSTKLVSGAKQIGFCNAGTSYNSEDVQGALEEVKVQADSNSDDCAMIKRDFVRRAPDDGMNQIWVLTGSYSFSPVAGGAVYDWRNRYFTQQDPSKSIYFSPVSCANISDIDDMDNLSTVSPAIRPKVYTYDAGTGEFTEACMPSTEAGWDSEKRVLYYFTGLYDGMQRTFEDCVHLGLYLGVASGGTDTDWRSSDTWATGLPHTAIICVTSGHNSGFDIIDDTIGQILVRVSPKGKYGGGSESVTAMCVKGHSVRVHCWATVDGGSGRWDRICITFFGD